MSLMKELILILPALSTITTIAFVVVSSLWLRRFKASMTKALDDALSQNIILTKRLSDSLCELQKQQQIHSQYVHKVAENQVQLRQNLADIAIRVENSERELYGIPEPRVLN
jgi:hypothetical protein